MNRPARTRGSGKVPNARIDHVNRLKQRSGNHLRTILPESEGRRKATVARRPHLPRRSEEYCGYYVLRYERSCVTFDKQAVGRRRETRGRR